MATQWVSDARLKAVAATDGWEVAAIFMLVLEQRDGERQTIARHVDADTDARWGGRFAIEEATRWMDEQLRDRRAGRRVRDRG